MRNSARRSCTSISVSCQFNSRQACVSRGRRVAGVTRQKRRRERERGREKIIAQPVSLSFSLCLSLSVSLSPGCGHASAIAIAHMRAHRARENSTRLGRVALTVDLFACESEEHAYRGNVGRQSLLQAGTQISPPPTGRRTYLPSVTRYRQSINTLLLLSSLLLLAASSTVKRASFVLAVGRCASWRVQLGA